MTLRRRSLLVVLLLITLLFAGCDRMPAPAADPGIDLSDPDVGGGAGVETGPQTPIPTATATREASPRLDPTAQASAVFPPTTTPEPTAGSQLPTAAPTAEAPTEAPEAPSATPNPPAATEIAPEPSPTPTPAGERVHVVQPGENLYRIGLQYGLSWVAVAEYNGITDPNLISAGQELRIPPSPTVTPTATAEAAAPADIAASPVEEAAATAEAVPPPASPATEDVHTVSAGDTLFGISRRYGVSWDQIAEANGLETPNQIYAGQVLKIPVDVPGPAPAFAHQVHRGETLSGLAKQYGLSPAALAEANGLAAPYTIYPGQVLEIPGGD